jgi:pilus assembly protein CpaF
MNTGHDGSLTTLHANSPLEAVARLETLCLMAGLDLPVKAIRDQIVGAVDLIVQQARFPDGARRITAISEISSIDEDGNIQQNEIFRYGCSSGGGSGEFLATGWLPSFYSAAKMFDSGAENRGTPC